MQRMITAWGVGKKELDGDKLGRVVDVQS